MKQYKRLYYNTQGHMKKSWPYSKEGNYNGTAAVQNPQAWQRLFSRAWWKEQEEEEADKRRN